MSKVNDTDCYVFQSKTKENNVKENYQNMEKRKKARVWNYALIEQQKEIMGKKFAEGQRVT